MKIDLREREKKGWRLTSCVCWLCFLLSPWSKRLEENKIKKKSRSRRQNSILHQCSPAPFSLGGNVNVKVRETSHSGQAYPDIQDLCVCVRVCTCVRVCLLGAFILNPVSLGSLTTSPSLWLAPWERQTEQEKGERLEKELEIKSRKKEKEQWSQYCSKAQ